MEKSRPYGSRQRLALWICILGWTALVGFWWLVKGSGGLSVWVFQERDLSQPGFNEKLQAIFRSDLGLQRAYPWILFSPYLALMAWYFPLERERLGRNLPLNAMACMAFVWACHAIDLRTTMTRPRFMMVNSDHLSAPKTPPMETKGIAIPGVGGRSPGGDGPVPLLRSSPGNFGRPPSPSRRALLRSTILDLLAYGALTGLVHSVNFYRRLQEREHRALFLESSLANARLNALKAQLQPHFLFKSLNAIAALLRRDPRLAETTLVALSELLRLTLNQSEQQEGELREELELVQRYLEIQQTRFGEKLRVEQNIEPQALDSLAPTLVLQPLVENAIRHGIEPAGKAGTVRVSASRKDENLVLTVEDDGVGLPGGNTDSSDPENPAELHPSLPTSARGSPASAVLAKTGTGIGLANLRERLRTLYGARQKLELTPRATGGVVVRVEIPWRPRASSHTAGPFKI
ncbi:MAG TPA: histidine kinase [Verrucomicrobiae bacterium]|nr:histidine kinase [Verrucomicrobiae bacterium]